MYYPTSQELSFEQEFELYIEAQERETERELQEIGFKDAYNGVKPSEMFDYSQAYKDGYGRGYVALIAEQRLKSYEQDNEDVPF